MSEFKLCSIEQAQQMIEQGNVAIADIRDAQSFADGHVENAFHLTNTSMGQFAKDVDFETTVLVFCYHGNSSKGAAQYLAQQGYEDVYSVNGGFEVWKLNYPFIAS